MELEKQETELNPFILDIETSRKIDFMIETKQKKLHSRIDDLSYLINKLEIKSE